MLCVNFRGGGGRGGMTVRIETEMQENPRIFQPPELNHFISLEMSLRAVL